MMLGAVICFDRVHSSPVIPHERLLRPGRGGTVDWRQRGAVKNRSRQLTARRFP
jgi:hypothetical protein